MPRLGLAERARQSRSQRLVQTAVSFRKMAVDMGGVMIKVGQFLSSRLDVLPVEVTNELSGLQDEVKSERYEDICRVIESEFHRPLDELFAEFTREPLASASIGQVHFARLRMPSGSDQGESSPVVVVKVQRPDIEKIVDVDLSALKVVGRWLNAYRPIRRRANVSSLLNEFSRSLYEEIDYLNEGKNAETFAKNFNSRPDICVPAVYWSHTSRRVLTLENVLAIKITDYAAIEEAGIDRAEVADRLFDVYLKQVFDDRFFHADPHPGNLFVLPTGEVDGSGKRAWKLVFVDFGMTGSISASMLDSLRELFIAVGTRDAGQVIHAYQLMGILLPGADIDLLEKAGTKVFERFWGKSTPEMMAMGHEEALELFNEFGKLIYELPFQIPENLILIGRTFSILLGICSGLNQNFNLWNTVSPYAERMAASEVGSNWKLIFQDLLGSITALVSLPGRAATVLNRMEQGRLEVRAPQVSEEVHKLRREQRRLTYAILFAGIFFGGIQLYINGDELPAVISGVLALILFFKALI